MTCTEGKKSDGGSSQGNEPRDVEKARRWFAEELRYVVRVGSAAVVEAFAERAARAFRGAGPWRILSPRRSEDYWTTEDDDPRRLYHDVLVAIDETRRLNNGQPSLWAQLFDVFNLAEGDFVIHVGAGQGYYSGDPCRDGRAEGHVTAIEIDPSLAARSAAGTGPRLASGDRRRGGRLRLPPDAPADAIVVNAGVSHISGSHGWTH